MDSWSRVSPGAGYSGSICHSARPRCGVLYNALRRLLPPVQSSKGWTSSACCCFQERSSFCCWLSDGAAAFTRGVHTKSWALSSSLANCAGDVAHDPLLPPRLFKSVNYVTTSLRRQYQHFDIDLSLDVHVPVHDPALLPTRARLDCGAIRHLPRSIHALERCRQCCRKPIGPPLRHLARIPAYRDHTESDRS